MVIEREQQRFCRPSVDANLMEVMDSPLNRAHQCDRRADRLLAQERHEEAIKCHGEAAEFLEKALQMTQCEQVRLSLELQRTRHLQQQRLIQDGRRQATLVGKTLACPAKRAASVPLSQPVQTALHRPYPDPSTPAPPLGHKAAKDDRTRLEEQSTAIADLRNLVSLLLAENGRLSAANESLRSENARLRRDPYTEEVRQSPRLSPATQPPPLPLLHLPPDLQEEIQEEIQELWETE